VAYGPVLSRDDALECLPIGLFMNEYLLTTV